MLKNNRLLEILESIKDDRPKEQMTCMLLFQLIEKLIEVDNHAVVLDIKDLVEKKNAS